jgi:hypothetical protein
MRLRLLWLAATVIVLLSPASPVDAQTMHRSPVPPQNPVERAIVDVFKLRIELTCPMRRLLYALLATARSSLRLQRELALENVAL